MPCFVHALQVNVFQTFDAVPSSLEARIGGANRLRESVIR